MFTLPLQHWSQRSKDTSEFLFLLPIQAANTHLVTAAFYHAHMFGNTVYCECVYKWVWVKKEGPVYFTRLHLVLDDSSMHTNTHSCLTLCLTVDVLLSFSLVYEITRDHLSRSCSTINLLAACHLSLFSPLLHLIYCIIHTLVSCPSLSILFPYQHSQWLLLELPPIFNLSFIQIKQTKKKRSVTLLTHRWVWQMY